MTLRQMVHSHDDTALEAITSKGLLRRASRDLEAGAGSIDALDETEAVVSVGGEKITLVAGGPAASSCTCKASGVCRHILLAIMLLREPLQNTVESDSEEVAASASERLCSASFAELKKFAGADWKKALALLGSEPASNVAELAPNVTVEFPELEASVTFISTGELKDAAFKGSKTRKRLLTTVAALIVRRHHGLVSETEDAPPSVGVSAAFIDDAQQTIERAVAATLPGRSATSPDMLLDLAVSTRCETLPRLSTELRALAREAQRACERHADFESAEFLLQASRSYALLESLRATPNDVQLTGTIRRDYQKADAIELWPLAVARWRGAGGARGLTTYAIDTASGQWLTASDGRAAGIDHSYSADRAYTLPLWGAGPLFELIGHQLHLAAPLIASDASLSAQSSGANSTEKLTLDAIAQSPAAHRNWQTLRRDLSTRMVAGVKRRNIALPVLIVPKRFGQMGFDDLHQCYHWQLSDDYGEPLIVSLPAEDDTKAIALWRMSGSIRALVCECRLNNNALLVRPVSVVSEVKGAVQIYNIDFDQLPTESGFRKMMANWRERLAKPLQVTHDENDSIRRLLGDAAEFITIAVENGSSGDSVRLLDRVESSGLSALHNALMAVSKAPELRSVLAAAYLVSELKFTEASGLATAVKA